MRPRRPTMDPRFAPLVGMIGRTGMGKFWLHYTDPDDGPVVWVAVAETKDARVPLVCFAAPDPLGAVYGLAARLVDEGTCRHCGNTSMLAPLAAEHDAILAPIDSDGRALCWYRWAPPTRQYVRDCQGTAP